MTRKPALDLNTFRLEVGSHSPGENMGCVMEFASYLARERFSDKPKCVSQVIGAFLRNWNDNLPDDKRQMLRVYAFRALDTNTGAADDETRAWMATDWLVRVQAPAWLDLAGLAGRAAELRALPPLTSSEIAFACHSVIEKARGEASRARDAARAAAWAAARAAAGAAARAAARDAAWDAARAAAWAAARAAAGAAARAAAGAAAWDAAWDAAVAAARAAANRRLAPTVEMLQVSALELLDRMIAVGRTPVIESKVREIAASCGKSDWLTPESLAQRSAFALDDAFGS